MVCKEEVFAWFQNLKGCKRIETMCQFMNMCYPLELRFYGTCLEDLGRKDFYVFREDEIRANDLAEIAKLRTIHQPGNRSKLIITLSLLNSSNIMGAKELYNVMMEEIKIDFLSTLGILTDPKCVDQYLLLLTLAQHHPAFTFEQQTSITDLTIALENYINELNSKTPFQEPCLSNAYFPAVYPHTFLDRDVYSCAPSTSHCYIPPPHPKSVDAQQFPVKLKNLKLKHPHKKTGIKIRVTWESNKCTDVHKTPHDLCVFYQKLIKMFPVEAQGDQDKCIPPLPRAISSWNKQSHLNDDILNAVSEFLQKLCTHLPDYVLGSEFVINFFSQNMNRSGHSRSNRATNSDIPPKRNQKTQSMTIHNSALMNNFEKRNKINPSPVNSPVESPMSSPYASPMNSKSNSRPNSPWTLAPSNFDPSVSNASADSTNSTKNQSKEHLPKHRSSVKNCKIDPHQMPVKELQKLHISKEPVNKSLKTSDGKYPPNGMITGYIHKSALRNKPVAQSQGNSYDSSEYSSPPQSPSPGETCNQSSSLSSSNEENAEKGKPALDIPSDIPETSAQEEAIKQVEEEEPPCPKGQTNRASVSFFTFPAPYGIMPPLQPGPLKPPYMQLPCRPPHMGPGFETHFPRVISSALTFLPTPRNSILSPVNMPTPFPIVTSGCATPCSTTATYKTNSMTTVTNSSSSVHNCRKKASVITSDKMSQSDVHPHGHKFAFTSTASGQCTCYISNSGRPSPSPSPSAQPGPAPVPYIGMPYMFQSIPILQPQTPNGFVPQLNSGQGFGFSLPNGLTIPSEYVYPAQSFALQQPAATQASAGLSATAPCFVYPHGPLPVKLPSCYNCGKSGHWGSDCKEKTMDDLSKPGKFKLNYMPLPKSSDSHE